VSLCGSLKLLIQTDLFFHQKSGLQKFPERLKIRILHSRLYGIDEDVKGEAISNLDWSSASGLDDDSSAAPANEVASNGSETSANHNPMSPGDQEPEIEVPSPPEDFPFQALDIKDRKVSCISQNA
jgi:hypothetical protein